MKPVLILQHLNTDGPSYLQQWLQAEGLAHEVFNTQAGQAFPATLAGYGALAILGGEMSANDELPSLRQAEVLFLQAMQAGVPTLGHCLGGQLMARALGAAVTASPAPEIGWQPLQVHAVAEAKAWFGDAGERQVFHWHSETFGLPPGAVWLARSPACPHQAFSIGPHLGMQFHVEVDEAKLRFWALENDEAWFDAVVPAALGGSVQRPAAMLAGIADQLPRQQALARRIYARWTGLAAGL
jgi:GMP synthase-like glutamine amidotransferase